MTQTVAPPSAPALVALSADPPGSPGRECVDRLLDSVRRALPAVTVPDACDVASGWGIGIEPGNPSSPAEPGAAPVAATAVLELIERLGAPSILVPLSLSSRHSAGHLPVAGGGRHEARVADPLGPDRLLARALLVRLRQAGAQWGDAVVLAAGDTSAPAALAAAEHETALLASEWGAPVTLACTSAQAPSVEEAVSDLHAMGADRVFVASYLLTPGPLADAVARSARQAHAAGVTDVLAGHRLLVELVVQRYRAALDAWGRGGLD